MLHVVLNVKFRAFGIDWGKVNLDKKYALPLVAEVVASFAVSGPKQIERFQKNGVDLTITLE